MPHTIMFWNVRNLSANLNRPGVRGRGVWLNTRAKEVGKDIASLGKEHEIDQVFLLEMGPDAYEPLKPPDGGGSITTINYIGLMATMNIPKTDTSVTPTYIPIGWNTGATQSLNTQFEGETVGFMQRSGTSYPLSAQDQPMSEDDTFLPEYTLIGSDDYRKGAYFQYENMSICVLHAPSPSHPIHTRLSVIKSVLNPQSPTQKPDIFLGDLNIKDTEFSQLKKEMDQLGYRFAGPGVEGNQVPTSLCKFTTITKGADSGSQPYDQVWVKNGFKRTIKVKVFKPSIKTDSLIAKMPQCLLNWIDEAKANLKKTYKLHHNKNIDNDMTNELNNLIDTFIGKKNAFSTTFKKRNKLADSAEKNLLKIMKNAIDELPKIIVSKSNQHLLLSDYLYRKSVLSEWNSVLTICNDWLNSQGKGIEGLLQQYEIIFEYCISDHYPVLFTIEDK